MPKPYRQSPPVTPLPRPRKRPLLGWVLVLFYRYPWIFWVGVWFSVAMIAWFALMGMINPGFDGESILKASRTQSGTPLSDQPVFIYQPNYPDAGMAWVVAAIALSCSIGSYVILRRLITPWNAREQPAVSSTRGKKRFSHYPFARKPIAAKPVAAKPVAAKPIVGKPVVERPNSHRKKPLPQPGASPQVQPHSKLPPLIKATQSPQKPISHQPAAQYISVREQMQAQSLQAKGRVKPIIRRPNVTVVPPDKSHALDWGEAGLANQMDIRKRRSYR